MTEIKQALKLGAGLGLAWGLILWGCRVNIPNPFKAFEVALYVFIVVIIVVFFFPYYAPQLYELLTQKEE